MTVKLALEWANSHADDLEAIAAMHEAEKAGRNRRTLVQGLWKILNPPKFAAHPAVMAYRDVAHHALAESVRELVADTVGEAEADVAFFRQVVLAWIATGYRKENVTGMLDWYRNREIPKKARASPKASRGSPNGQDSVAGDGEYPVEKREEQHIVIPTGRT